MTTTIVSHHFAKLTLSVYPIRFIRARTHRDRDRDTRSTFYRCLSLYFVMAPSLRTYSLHALILGCVSLFFFYNCRMQRHRGRSRGRTLCDFHLTSLSHFTHTFNFCLIYINVICANIHVLLKLRVIVCRVFCLRISTHRRIDTGIRDKLCSIESAHHCDQIVGHSMRRGFGFPIRSWAPVSHTFFRRIQVNKALKFEHTSFIRKILECLNRDSNLGLYVCL